MFNGNDSEVVWVLDQVMGEERGDVENGSACLQCKDSQ